MRGGGGGITDHTAVRDQMFMRQHSHKNTETFYVIMNV